MKRDGCGDRDSVDRAVHASVPFTVAPVNEDAAVPDVSVLEIRPLAVFVQ